MLQVHSHPSIRKYFEEHKTVRENPFHKKKMYFYLNDLEKIIN